MESAQNACNGFRARRIAALATIFDKSGETIHVTNMIIHELADTTHYDVLCAASATQALAGAEDLAVEIFRLADFDEPVVRFALVAWIAKPEFDPSTGPVPHGAAPWIAPHVQR